MVTIRKLIPRHLNDAPEWELSRDGQVVGWIKQERIGRSIVTFYHLYGVHPETGARVNLELSGDFEERLRVLETFLDDPSTAARHIGF